SATHRSLNWPIRNERHQHVLPVQRTVRRYVWNRLVVRTKIPIRSCGQYHVATSRARRDARYLYYRIRIETAHRCIECIALAHVIALADSEGIARYGAVRVSRAVPRDDGTAPVARAHLAGRGR